MRIFAPEYDDVTLIQNNRSAIQLAQIIHGGEQPNLDDRVVDLKRLCKSNLPEELGKLVDDLHTLFQFARFRVQWWTIRPRDVHSQGDHSGKCTSGSR